MIRARIKEVTGLNASAGISYCKFLTKMERLGILTGKDLEAKPLSFLQQHFGKSGALRAVGVHDEGEM